MSRNIEAYDVVQIFSDLQKWMDFYTIRSEADIDRAIELTETGWWEGRRRGFRIVSANKQTVKLNGLTVVELEGR